MLVQDARDESRYGCDARYVRKAKRVYRSRQCDALFSRSECRQQKLMQSVSNIKITLIRYGLIFCTAYARAFCAPSSFGAAGKISFAGKFRMRLGIFCRSNTIHVPKLTTH